MILIFYIKIILNKYTFKFLRYNLNQKYLLNKLKLKDNIINEEFINNKI